MVRQLIRTIIGIMDRGGEKVKSDFTKDRTLHHFFNAFPEIQARFTGARDYIKNATQKKR